MHLNRIIESVMGGEGHLIRYTGYVKHIDATGRLVLPTSLRSKFGLQNKTQVEFLVDGDSIILRKYNPACIFCGNTENLVKHSGKCVCDECINILQNRKKTL